MRYLAIFMVLGIVGLSALAFAAGNTPMMFIMDESEFAHKNAHVKAFSTAASDFELPARPIYLADAGKFLYQVRSRNLVPPYDSAPMVLWGEDDDGSVLCHYFTPSPGKMDAVSWVLIPAPTVVLNGTTATVSWVLPSVQAQAVDRWKLVIDGNPQALPTSPYNKTGLSVGAHTFSLRLLAVGSPKAHKANGLDTIVEVLP